MRTTDVLGCVGGAAFFLLSAALIPLIGPLFSLLTPLPFLYYSSKLGFLQGLKLAALATLFIGLTARLAGLPHMILLGAEFSLFGLILAELFRRKFSLGQTIFFATLSILMLGIGFLLFLGLSKNMGPQEMILGYFQDQLKLPISAWKEMGIPQEKALEFEASGKAFLDILSKIYPALMVIGTGFAVWLNVVIAKALFRIGNLEYPDFGPADRWQAPDVLVWVVIASGFALFLSSGSIKLFAVNGLIIMLAVYFFHGLSIVLFFLNKYKVPPWIRVGIYFLLMIQQVFVAILALAGLFDQWVDFRKIHRKHPETQG